MHIRPYRRFYFQFLSHNVLHSHDAELHANHVRPTHFTSHWFSRSHSGAPLHTPPGQRGPGIDGTATRMHPRRAVASCVGIGPLGTAGAWGLRSATQTATYSFRKLRIKFIDAQLTHSTHPDTVIDAEHPTRSAPRLPPVHTPVLPSPSQEETQSVRWRPTAGPGGGLWPASRTEAAPRTTPMRLATLAPPHIRLADPAQLHIYVLFIA